MRPAALEKEMPVRSRKQARHLRFRPRRDVKDRHGGATIGARRAFFGAPSIVARNASAAAARSTSMASVFGAHPSAGVPVAEILTWCPSVSLLRSYGSNLTVLSTHSHSSSSAVVPVAISTMRMLNSNSITFGWTA